MPEWPDFHFIAGRAEHSSSPLLLLHGSGSDEAALIPLADAIAPQRPYMALRGAVEWEEGFAFFRRNPDRSLDHVDLDSQTDRLCRFITTAIERKLLAQPPVLLGFSNGAIMAASILQRRPGLASSAILMRPLSPAPDAEFPSMPALPILIISGENDQRREPGDAELVRQQFANAGADVSALVLPTDHGLHQDEADIIRDWLIRKGI
ncbi:esterase [Rhizobium sp. SG741]|uniref:alpha/beta hydrolase n=1 Tax=Rhizobium sp. SG741 TaxID=2587114 RepID=UPI00068C6346|nr:esterase [Rhizobium sp. SG741]NKJ05743.1 phospholipase/carboxylesterase [Rhizobium sp. SG741]NRP85743.1 putative hydrolase MhqD [Ensifer adhaerens]